MIQLENLHFSYGKREILNNINLQIARNSFIALMGKSGSGKSTLLYILGGFIKPKQGDYIFEKKSVFRIGEFGLGGFRKKNIGYLFQDFRLLPFLNVEQNIRFPFYFSGKKFEKEKLNQLLLELGIENRRKAYPRDISGGEAQRVALGRALMLEPHILLLDEPTGNLDEKTEKEILDILLRIKQRGITLVCVTHSRKIGALADEIWFLDNGKITVTKNNNGGNLARVEKADIAAKSKTISNLQKKKPDGKDTGEKKETSPEKLTKSKIKAGEKKTISRPAKTKSETASLQAKLKEKSETIEHPPEIFSAMNKPEQSNENGASNL